MENNFGYVYLLIEIDDEGTELFKIGISKNDPELRLKNLRTGNPNNVNVLKSFKSLYYKKIEKWLHRKFHNKKTLANNEWFKLSNDDISNFILECQKAEEIIIFMLVNNNYFS